MKTDGRLGWVLLSIMSFFGAAEAATLTSPACSGDQFQFELQGDAYRHYVIQGSTNLVNWVSLTTNVSSSATRPLSFTASDEFQFYRSAPFILSNPLSEGFRLAGALDLNGKDFIADSFNSTNSIASTVGLYDPAKRRDWVSLCLDAGLTNSRGFGNATVYGFLAIGPGAPYQIGQLGSVGNKQWHDAGNTGIQLGRISFDRLNPHFPDVDDPFPLGDYSTPIPRQPVTNVVVTTSPEGYSMTNISVETYSFVFENGSYRVSNLFGEVLVSGHARVHVTGSLSITNPSDYIRIKTNASLKLYVDVPDVRIGGNGIVNDSGNATNFIYYGMPANTNLSLLGYTSVTGIFYAPQTRIAIGSSGNGASDFIGAIVADSLYLNGHWHFHYDEALRDLPFPE